MELSIIITFLLTLTVAYVCLREKRKRKHSSLLYYVKIIDAAGGYHQQHPLSSADKLFMQQ